ncbi:MAG: hypothetical protein R2864_08440 [Syntrophotaleaceae bacterium]
MRFLTLKDLYDPDDGNSELAAELTRNYEVGVEQALPAKTLLAVNLDSISNRKISSRRSILNRCGRTTTSTSFTVWKSVENSYLDRLSVRASYSYMTSEDKSDGAGTRRVAEPA